MIFYTKEEIDDVENDIYELKEKIEEGKEEKEGTLYGEVTDFLVVGII